MNHAPELTGGVHVRERVGSHSVDQILADSVDPSSTAAIVKERQNAIAVPLVTSRTTRDAREGRSPSGNVRTRHRLGSPPVGRKTRGGDNSAGSGLGSSRAQSVYDSSQDKAAQIAEQKHADHSDHGSPKEQWKKNTEMLCAGCAHQIP